MKKHTNTYRTAGLALCLAGMLANGGALAADNPIAASSRYIIRGGEVYDKNSDLTWARCSVGQRWDNSNGCVGIIKAYTFDQALRLSGNGWRVPSKDELATLIDYRRKAQNLSPTIDVEAFPDMNEGQFVYWSSTPSAASYVWNVHFLSGSFYGYGLRSYTLAVRLVRGGQ